MFKIKIISKLNKNMCCKVMNAWVFLLLLFLQL